MQLKNIKLREIYSWGKEFEADPFPMVRFKDQFVIKSQGYLRLCNIKDGTKFRASIFARCYHTCSLCKHPSDEDCILECCSQCVRITSYSTLSRKVEAVCDNIGISTICTGQSGIIYGFDSSKGIVQLKWLISNGLYNDHDLYSLCSQ